MRATFTIGRKHGSRDFVVIVGPDRPPSAHRAFKRSVIVKKQHDRYAEVYIATASRVLRLKPGPGAPKPEPKKTILQTIVNAVRPDAPKADSKPAAKKTAPKAKASSAFSARLAATQPPIATA